VGVTSQTLPGEVVRGLGEKVAVVLLNPEIFTHLTNP